MKFPNDTFVIVIIIETKLLFSRKTLKDTYHITLLKDSEGHIYFQKIDEPFDKCMGYYRYMMTSTCYIQGNANNISKKVYK